MQLNTNAPATNEATASTAPAADAPAPAPAPATDKPAPKASDAPAKRKPVKAKPGSAKAKAPTKAELAAKAKADKAAAEKQAAATTSRGLARDAATVRAQATNFEQYSDRDTAFLRFFGTVMRKNGDKATLAQIHAAGKPVTGKPNRTTNPFYTGSSKSTDAGAINRLVKAGYIKASADGSTLTVTAAGKTQSAYNGKA